MPIGEPKDLIDCQRFFLEPKGAKQRQYEALRAFFVDERPSAEVAHQFGYTPGSFAVLCHHFRREEDPVFFVTPVHGPQAQPKKSGARAVIVELRKKNYSVYDISDELKSRGMSLSSTAVGEVLKEEGFSSLPRRLDEERPTRPGPSHLPAADVRAFSMAPRRFTTACGGLFLFIADLVRLGVSQIAPAVRLPGSKMIPSQQAILACLALKLWSIERKSHVMPFVADEGLAFFAGLNVIPKKSFLSEYSSRIAQDKTNQILKEFHRCVQPEVLYPGESFNLDFHSVPFFGEDPLVERHYVSMRSRSQKAVLAFLAQDADGHAFCYSNASLRKGEEADEIFRFIEFWKATHGSIPKHLVFDSRLTTQPNLARLDNMGVKFITLRRRTPTILKEVAAVPRSAWRTIKLDVPTRKYQTPRIYEQMVILEKQEFRQLFIQDLGHDKPTVLLTNDRKSSHKALVTRYAQRMLIENALSDAVRFFHVDALTSSVGLKVDLDMALLVIASGMYRLLAKRMRGYADSQARRIFRDLIDMPATVEITAEEVHVELHRRAHLPIVLSSGILGESVNVPWWGGLPLRITG
jgi:hypothetical protein